MTACTLSRRAAVALALLASAPLAAPLGAQTSTIVGGGLTGPNVVAATSYALLNGSQGTWRYVDYTYASAACGGVCPGANTLGAALSGGLGLLTDGVQAPGGYGTAAFAPGNPQGYYVGWLAPNNAAPTVTFDFASPFAFDVLRIHLEDTADVPPPASIMVTMGAQSETYTITDPAGRNPFWAELDLGSYFAAPASQVQLTFAYAPGAVWLMTSEVDFAGVSAVPEPATIGLVALGLLGVGAASRRRRTA